MRPEREDALAGARDASKIARQRLHQGTSTTVCQRQILARAGALALTCTAMATGVSDFEPTQSMIEATAALASSLAFDIWIQVEAAA